MVLGHRADRRGKEGLGYLWRHRETRAAAWLRVSIAAVVGLGKLHRHLWEQQRGLGCLRPRRAHHALGRRAPRSQNVGRRALPDGPAR